MNVPTPTTVPSTGQHVQVAYVVSSITIVSANAGVHRTSNLFISTWFEAIGAGKCQKKLRNRVTAGSGAAGAGCL